MSDLSTATDLLSGVSIVEIWHALGGGEIKQRRGRAFWRKGDGWNISIDAHKQCWYDFVAAKGGGILDLVETVRECNHADAIEWLRKFTGTPRRDVTEVERERYRQRKQRADTEAQALVRFDQRISETLHEYEHLNFHLFHHLKWRILNADYSNDEELVALMIEAEEAEEKYLRGERARDLWRSASHADILEIYRKAQL
jgi:hypothetical protein